VYVLLVAFQVPPPIFLVMVVKGTVLKPLAAIVAFICPPEPLPNEAIKRGVVNFGAQLSQFVPSK